MNTIWKYPLEITREQFISIPHAHEILSIGWQEKNLCLWVRVNPAFELVQKKILMFGTGMEIENNPPIGRHIGTIFQGLYVWHFFENEIIYSAYPPSLEARTTNPVLS